MFEQVVEFGFECRIDLGSGIFALQIENQRHQRFSDVAPAKLAEMPAFIGLGPKRIFLV